MTLVAELASIVGALVSVLALLLALMRAGIHLTWYRGADTTTHREFEFRVGTRLVLKRSRSVGTVSQRVPFWALIMFEPEEAERWSKEVEAHIWELLEIHALKQARRDRRKLILRGLLLAVVLRVDKRLKRARRRS